MLELDLHPNGIVTYQSPKLIALAVPHAFSTRVGGVSRGPYCSMNLNNRPAEGADGDAIAEVQENYRRLQSAVNARDLGLAWTTQAHGGDAAVVETADQPVPPADALVTHSKDVLLSIRVADCVPILLADRSGRCVAAVHAGWRGVVAAVVTNAVSTMAQHYGCRPADLTAAVGPCISVEHFEVGDEVAAEFERVRLGEAVDSGRGRRPHVDLPRAVLRQLVESGIDPANIDTTDCCTYSDEAMFFSHRRDRGMTGRMAAVIAVNSA